MAVDWLVCAASCKAGVLCRADSTHSVQRCTNMAAEVHRATQASPVCPGSVCSALAWMGPSSRSGRSSSAFSSLLSPPVTTTWHGQAAATSCEVMMNGRTASCSITSCRWSEGGLAALQPSLPTEQPCVRPQADTPATTIPSRPSRRVPLTMAISSGPSLGSVARPTLKPMQGPPSRPWVGMTTSRTKRSTALWRGQGAGRGARLAACLDA